MQAMILRSLGRVADDCHPLTHETWPDPAISPYEILIKVKACGVCHTELDEIEGRVKPATLPIILGHQVVGTVEAVGNRAGQFTAGDRVGVAWIYSACGHCTFCRAGRENLCPQFLATGRDVNGGYAEEMAISGAFAFPLPDNLTDMTIAPLMCAGSVGYRSLKLCELKDGQALGFMGFGASAHLVLQLAQRLFPNSKTYVFARTPETRDYARGLGADWCGDTDDQAPESLKAIIDTTPVWRPVVASLSKLQPGGRLIINAIRKQDDDKHSLGALDYSRDLWLEKSIKSVANVTRDDVRDFLRCAAETGIQPNITAYPLEDANRALADLKAGRGLGAKVLVME